MTVKVVVALRPEVPPVAVMVFDPPVVSATTNGPVERVHAPKLPRFDPVVHVMAVVAGEDHAVVDPETVSALPKPATANDPVTDCCGKP